MLLRREALAAAMRATRLSNNRLASANAEGGAQGQWCPPNITFMRLSYLGARLTVTPYG